MIRAAVAGLLVALIGAIAWLATRRQNVPKPDSDGIDWLWEWQPITANETEVRLLYGVPALRET